MRVGLYARVSTHDQQTLPLQLSAMTDHATRRGWTITVQIEDVGSGASTRPRREELLRAARRREIDAVLVWRLDRWGRSLVDLITTLKELSALGVGFVSITEALDLTTPSGRAMAGMLAVFSEFEREILRDRVKAGIAQARRQGKRHGRPATVSAHAEAIRAMLSQGVSKREIAKRLGISRTSVRRSAA
jgi:DNA invertase Pin-like site-specific DNA recombinase